MSDDPQVKVGQFYLTKGTGEGRIWIRHESGEGGDFNEYELAALIEQFYNERF